MAERPVPEALAQLDRYRLEIVPLLAVGDGGLGRWAALREVLGLAKQHLPFSATADSAKLAQAG